MEHYYTYDRVIEAPPGSFNKYEYEQIRIAANTEFEAWDELAERVGDTSGCKLVWVDDGEPVQTWTGSRSPLFA